LNSLNKNRKELERMARLSSIEIIDILSDNLIQFSISGISFGLDLNGVIDVQQELDRLDKELKKINIDLSAVDKKLSNEQFLNNAPKEIIEKQESIRKELNSNKDEIISSIEKISKIS
jgi:valyl-tRNA synthetase